MRANPRRIHIVVIAAPSDQQAKSRATTALANAIDQQIVAFLLPRRVPIPISGRDTAMPRWAARHSAVSLLVCLRAKSAVRNVP